MAGEMRAATKRMRSRQTRLVRSLRMRMRLQMEKIEEPTGESEERQPAQGPASIKRRIKLQRRLHRPGGPFDREKGGQRPFDQMASKKRFGLGIKIWP